MLIENINIFKRRMIIVDPRDIVSTGTSTSRQPLPPTLGWLCFRRSDDIAVSSARSKLDFSRQYSRSSEGMESDIGSMFRLDVSDEGLCEEEY